MSDGELRTRRARRALGVLLGFVGLFGAVVASAVLSGAAKVSAVLSGSMVPRFRPGDALVMAPTSGKSLRVGEIVMFRAPLPGHPLVAHRVVSLTAGFFQTKGDANNAPDMWAIPRSHGQLWHLVTVVPHLGSLICAAHSADGVAVVAGFAGAVVALLALRGFLSSGSGRHVRRGPLVGALSAIASLCVVGTTSVGALALLSSTVSSQYQVTSGTVVLNMTGDLTGTSVVPAGAIADGDTVERAITLENTGTAAWSKVLFSSTESSNLSANQLADPSLAEAANGGTWDPVANGGNWGPETQGGDWSSGPLALVGSGASGNAVSYTGTGAPSGDDIVASEPMTFAPGTQLKFSGTIDASNVTAGQVGLGLIDGSGTVHGFVGQAAGQVGEVSGTYTVSSTDGPLSFVFDTAGATVAGGQVATFSQPSVQVVGAPSVDAGANGFQLQVDKCSVPWTPLGTTQTPVGDPGPYDCPGTQTTLLPAGPALMTAPVSLPGLGSLAPGGTDYLRVRVFLPLGTDVNAFEGQAPVYNLTFQAVQRAPSVTNN